MGPITTIILADGRNQPHCVQAIEVETESFNASCK